MPRLIRPGAFTITVALIAVTAWVPSTAAASGALSPAQVRAQFTTCGYGVDTPGAPSTGRYIILRDPDTDPRDNVDARIAMAIVYTDARAAASAHQYAHALAEQQIGEHRPYSDDNGPQLLDGYGGSVWRANVALVESNTRTLDSMFTSNTETGEMTVARPELLDLGFVSVTGQFAVDRDFVECLEGALAVFADGASIGAPQPNTVPGRPW